MPGYTDLSSEMRTMIAQYVYEDLCKGSTGSFMDWPDWELSGDVEMVQDMIETEIEGQKGLFS